MANVIQFKSPQEILENRKQYIFISKPVPIVTEDGNTVHFPCIGLYHRETGIPVGYPKLEPYLYELNLSEMQATNTLKKKSYNLCAFLNYLIWNTQVDTINDVTYNDIRDFLVSFRKLDNGESRDPGSWYKGLQDVYDFLKNYYDYHREQHFSYDPTELVTTQVIRNVDTHRKSIVKRYNKLSIKPPRKYKTKNRQLLRGYLDLLLYECMAYDPMLTLGVALQAYAGIREGEVVNLTHEKVVIIYGTFGRISKIILNLTEEADFAKNWRGASSFGSIKKYRKQEVYYDFLERTFRLYNDHDAWLRTHGYSIEKDAPLFVNRWGKPMAVSTYTGRLRKLFYEHFLPDLKKYCELQNTWADNAALIEAYESDYPGGHMLRHWFTMYLVERTNLSTDEISKWRGDHNRESMLTYVHVNADMLQMYRESAFVFQEKLLEEVL